MFSVDCQILLVNRSLVDSFGARVIDDFTQQNAVLDFFIQSLALGIDWQQRLKVGIALQMSVE